MIVVDKLWPTFVKVQDFNGLQDYGVKVSAYDLEYRNREDVFFVSWGDPAYQTRGLTIETGFFHEALHLDRFGLYERASFNFQVGRDQVFKASFPKPWSETKAKIKSKFGQPKEDVKWDGIVIVAQHPTDRSVLKAGSTGDYHRFLDHLCCHYKSKAFVKLHPVTLGNSKELETVRSIAKKHGCQIGHVGPSVLEECEAVWVYNSTYAVDAMMANKPIYQYAPGYFWQSGQVEFTNFDTPKGEHHVDIAENEQFLSFLAWRYCFHSKMNLQRIADMLNHAEKTKDFFPISEEYSYAKHLFTEPT